MAEVWESHALAVVVPMASARRLCARGARRGSVAATFARRDERAAWIVVWAAPGAAGGAQPIGTVAVRWGAPDAGEATLAELSWPPTLGEAELWRAIEELAGHPIPR
jgi:hypothetical protein